MKSPHQSQPSPNESFETTLRAALHEELRAPSGQDFTDRVLAGLPQRRQRRGWRWAPYAGALVGGLLFTFVAPEFSGDLARLSTTTWGFGNAVSNLAPWIPLVLTGIVCSGLSMLERR